jgi:predicted HTH domain antitoxin
MEENISVRIPSEELLEIKKLAEGARTQSVLLREVLRLGIKQKKLEIAIEKFQKSEASAAKAARIAGISLAEFLEVLHERGINFHYGVEDLRVDFENIMKYDK